MAERILIVEDAHEIAEPLGLLLSLEGYEVEVTPSGLDGLVRAVRRPPDVLLLDLQVDDLSGFGVERALRDVADLPIVVMSASHDGWIDDAIANGATACLRKPFDATQLVELVSAILRASRPVPPWRADVRALSADDAARVAKLSPAQLDALPFGAMRLDAAGRILSYNAYEARAAQTAMEEVVGLRFADLAPCAMVREFFGVIEDGLRRGALDDHLHYVFPYYGASCVVSVRLWLDPDTREVWLFTSMRPGGAARRSRASVTTMQPERPSATRAM